MIVYSSLHALVFSVAACIMGECRTRKWHTK